MEYLLHILCFLIGIAVREIFKHRNTAKDVGIDHQFKRQKEIDIKYEKLNKRNDEVHKYRTELIKRDINLFKQLPSHAEMLYSDKPLTDENWINHD